MLLIKIILSLLTLHFCLAQAKVSLPCKVCHSLVNTLRNSNPTRIALPTLQKIAIEYCVTKHLQDRKVCKGAIKQMTKYIFTGLWRHYTNPHIVCQDVFICQKQYVKRNLTIDIENILKNKPNKTWQKPTNRKVLKIVHVSDPHPDLYYAAGSVVDCTEPICCRSNSTAKGNSTRKAGYWGSIGACDLPIQTFDALLQEVKKIKPDAIIWTGDNTPHDVWQQTQSYNLNFTIILAEKIKHAVNTTVIPSMGNHQSWPVNVYDYFGQRQNMLNSGLSQAWRYWLDEKAIKMQRQKGYFSMVYPQLNNVKVLSINTQAGNHQNWLLLEDPSDPGQILEWIQKQLKESEQKNQMVYLTGHIPPRSMMNDWAMRYNALVDRYSYIIRGQFYGHMHSDHISFFPEMKYSSNISHSKITGFYLAAPSMTTASDRVPQYRVMDIDFDTLQVLDYSQYRLDLRKYQREDQVPQFQLLYKFKEAYKIGDMTLQGGITQFRNKLRDTPQIQKLYSFYQNGGLYEGKSGLGTFCDTTTSPQFSYECNGLKFKKTAVQKAAGPWREFKHKSK